MVVINPTERIDCGVCEPECPADAIKPDSDDGWETWLELNTQFSVQWPNVTGKRKPAADATDYDGVAGKFAAHLFAEPRIRRLTGLLDRNGRHRSLFLRTNYNGNQNRVFPASP
jgi:ferredoxin